MPGIVLRMLIPGRRKCGLTANGFIEGTVSSYTNNVAPIEKDIIITCNFKLASSEYWDEQTQEYGVSGTWTSNSELLGTNGTIDWPWR